MIRPKIYSYDPPAALSLPIEVQRLAPDHFVHSAGLHGHRFHELVVFESAGDVHRVGSREAESSVGMLDAIGAGQVHAVDLSASARGWIVLFPDRALELARLPNDLTAWFSRRGNDALGHVSMGRARLARVQRYLAALEANQQVTARNRDAVTLALFSAILQDLRTGHALASPAHAPLRHFERLLETIDARFAQRLSLADLADAAGLSAAYLTTELRQRTGRTAMQWLLTRRMTEARRLLAESDLSVTQIAQDVGFEDSSYFARRFRVLHDVSPARWRENRRPR